MREHGVLVSQRRIARGKHNATIPDRTLRSGVRNRSIEDRHARGLAVDRCGDRLPRPRPDRPSLRHHGRHNAVPGRAARCRLATLPQRSRRPKAAAPQLSHDWGSQFTSRRYTTELSTLEIRSRPTMIGSPEHNAIVERFYKSLNDEELWRVGHAHLSDRRPDRRLPHPAATPSPGLPETHRVPRRDPPAQPVQPRQPELSTAGGPLHNRRIRRPASHRSTVSGTLTVDTDPGGQPGSDLGERRVESGYESRHNSVLVVAALKQPG